jgi:16S rRNA processing protein RimM
MDAASRYENSLLSVERGSVPLEDGEFFYDQIIGLSAFTTEGALIGQVVDIFETGSNDVYVVRQDAKEYLIPAIKDVVKEIDLGNKRIIIKVMEGLLD